MPYNPGLARVKVDLHAKNQGQGSNNSNRRVHADRHANGQTDGQMLTNILSPFDPCFAVDKKAINMCPPLFKKKNYSSRNFKGVVLENERKAVKL